MRVSNHHSRSFGEPPELVGACLDSLSGQADSLWPYERWPRMGFDRPLAVGAKGGHGPIRYFVEEYEPGRKITFRFTKPDGFQGTHGFHVTPTDSGCELRHVIEMRVSGPALLTWPVVFRPLHDALLEDALDKVEANLSGRAWARRDLPLVVRILRRILANRGRTKA
ncbi:MAG: SRPBCC family protein [Gemmatimonadetes bacterium]|nr:SRPBCC family protein [Gemmatimonadota bacterium]NNM03727.1 SRPBCC family protein [Gemmatimonadota bacterium]